MSADVVIRAERLGKKYLIGHEAKRERYTALRDVAARKAKAVLRATSDMLHGRAIVAGDTIEEFWALQDVNFEIKRGDVVGFIGRNGAGKSTLLKILSRISEPTAGRVEIRGRVASLLEVGTGFHPELTGRENIFLNGAILGMTRAEIRHRFDEIVAFAGVEKFLDTPVKRYSSGMYIRLAFAVAAHLEPEILIVDEVLAVGDADFQKKCIGKMSEVAGGGRTVLFVSHNMNSIEQLCRQVYHLRDGRVAGTYDNVKEGIMNYLAGGGSNMERIWVADGRRFGNDYFHPRRLEVMSAAPGKSEVMPFPNSYPIRVIISGILNQVEAELNIGIGLYNEKEELLFWAFTTDTNEATWPRLKIGFVQLQTTIPAHLLNEGSYRIELLASIHGRLWLLEPGGKAPSVAFRIRGGLSDSKLWNHKRPGLLAPVLDWQLVSEETPAMKAEFEENRHSV